MSEANETAPEQTAPAQTAQGPKCIASDLYKREAWEGRENDWLDSACRSAILTEPPDLDKLAQALEGAIDACNLGASEDVDALTILLDKAHTGFNLDISLHHGASYDALHDPRFLLFGGAGVSDKP